MIKRRQAAFICLLVCLCCLLGGCRESILKTVYMSACESAANGETCSATFYGTYYIETEASQELTEILNPSCWKQTTATETTKPYFSVRFPIAELDFYEGNLLCITVAQTGEQGWYISQKDISAQMEQYRQHHWVILPDLKDYDGGIYF